MKQKLLSFFLLLTMLISSAYAQERRISGRVTDEKDGSPIPGVSVLVAGSSVGTQTDADGKYSLSVPETAQKLSFRFIGYSAQEIEIDGKSVINASLIEDAAQLSEVVVTAMGQTRQARTIGYAASTVSSEEITKANNMNAMTGLQGKVAGVSVSNSGTTGGSTKVVIRGVSSFSGNNPLYIVDGVPISNGYQSSISSTNSVDLGNQANDINPNDIESMTILKGASATALYGSRAAHGVVMITTKKGKLGDKLKIAYNGAVNFSNVLMVPQTQQMFGQGWPFFDPIENGSWGPKLDGQIREWGTEVDGVRQTKPFAYVEDNIRNFYGTGIDYTNGISFSGGGEHNAFIFSYNNSSQKGVLPGHPDNFARNNFSFRGNAKYGKFEANYGINYVRRDLNAVYAGQGSSDAGNSTFQELIQVPVDISIESLKDLSSPYNNYDNFYTPYAGNPYKALEDNGAKVQDDRVYGNLELSYEIVSGLKAVGRIGGDFANIRTKSFGAVVNYTPGSFSDVTGKAPIVGRYGENYRKTNQIDATFMLQGDYNLTQDISLNASAGYNYNQRGYTFLDNYVSGLNVPGWYSLLNTSSAPVIDHEDVRQRLMGAFADATFGYKNFWFVNGSFRSDWSSTLPVNNNNYIYGGVNTSLIVTDLFKDLQTDNFNYLKLRAAWGKTGADASTYLTENNYEATVLGLGFGNLRLPLNGVAGLQHNKTLGNSNLKPEITTEIEFGGEAKFLDNRIGLDVSYYNRKTKDQIYALDIAPESGYTRNTLNIGNIQNKGIEAALTLVPVRTEDFRWDFGVNFTKNTSEVLALYEGTKELNIYSAYLVDFVAEVGQPLGVYKVPQIATVQDGEYAGKTIVTGAGLPQTDPNNKKNVGQFAPDFKMGFNTRFTYKNWSLSALLDWSKGGKFYSYTAQLNNFVGNSTETTFNERQPFLVPNSVKQVVVNGQPTYVENDIPVSMNNTYAYWYSNTNNSMYEHAVLDRDFVKLRELVLSYSLPESLVSRLKLQGVAVSFIGRNLFLWTPKSNNFVDPESTNYGNDIYSNFGEFAAGPTFRSFGGSLRITF